MYKEPEQNGGFNPLDARGVSLVLCEHLSDWPKLLIVIACSYYNDENNIQLSWDSKTLTQYNVVMIANISCLKPIYYLSSNKNVQTLVDLGVQQ